MHDSFLSLSGRHFPNNFVFADFDLLIMHQLSVTSLFICLWLLERCHGNSSLGNSLNDLHTQFGISLYQTLTETENNSNLIVSPASVSLCLGLLQLGARGNTLAQLEGALGYDVNDARVQDIMSRPQGDLGNSSEGVRLQLANALFVQSGVKLLPEFTQHALGWGNSSLLSVNFSNPNHTHSRLQQWASSQRKADDHLQTREEQLQSSEAQEEASRQDSLLHMALLSMVVFQGAWQKQFLFTDTQNLPFSLSDGRTVKVPMMYQSTEVNIGHFRLPSEQEYTVLELPYLDRSLRLLVALPSDRKTPLSQLEKQLTARAVGLWDTGLRRTKMDIFLPRFKMQSRFNLKPVLKSLGISDVFSPSAADLRGISDGEGLFVSEAFHEARIEVTEEGTKAASATAMVLLKRSRSAVLKADRPFLFILRQISTGSVLFIGRVLNPAEMS
uniref:Serpin peptidase inhibitor, clade E (nexin, plasminogen activator inhibitor type 1), member 3 n=1 Tax=Cyprinus carpio TaxID=7962 RepID=A0A8C1JLR3_CYPCA